MALLLITMFIHSTLFVFVVIIFERNGNRGKRQKQCVYSLSGWTLYGIATFTVTNIKARCPLFNSVKTGDSDHSDFVLDHWKIYHFLFIEKEAEQYILPKSCKI